MDLLRKSDVLTENNKMDQQFPIRILHVVNSMNRGGMESRTMDLYRMLDRTRFQFDFYITSGNKGLYDDEISLLGGNIYYNKGSRRQIIPNMKAFRLFLQDHKEFRGVYAYNQWAGWYLKEAARVGIPVRIASSRTSVQTNNLKNVVKNLVKRNVNCYATHRFAVSRNAAEWLFGKEEVVSGKVTVWANAIDTGRFAFDQDSRSRIRSELGLNDSFIVIHVGNIRYEKNHKYLLRVFSEIRKKHDNAALVLVGAGDFGTLTECMSELQITDSVYFLGVREDVPDLLNAGDVFIFPSLYEGFPGAVLEAEASGLNCIISDSITDEVKITDNIVYLSLNEEPDKWAEAVDEFGINNREKAWVKVKEAGYDIAELVERTERFYEEVLC